LAGALALLAILAPQLASATPNPNSAVLHLRIFNDCPTSTLTTDNSYPAQIWIDDADLSCENAFANLHNWRLSENGVDPAVFNNNANFRLAVDLVLSGTGNAESGLQVAPWWSQDVDGRLNVRLPDGEIAAFGGRLPFFSFTGTYGINYQRGELIHLEVIYHANGLSQSDPATMEYKVTYQGTDYTSGPLAFDEGNGAEGHGTWGILDDARVGAHLQCFMQAGNHDSEVRGTWSNIEFVNLDPTPVLEMSWGKLKSTYR
jgi:hypothetical protein